MSKELATFQTLQPFHALLLKHGHAFRVMQDGTLIVDIPMPPVNEGDDPGVREVPLKTPADIAAFLVTGANAGNAVLVAETRLPGQHAVTWVYEKDVAEHRVSYGHEVKKYKLAVDAHRFFYECVGHAWTCYATGHGIY